MTISFQSRRGSALLVVLGMLAFMLFSGLAFSVYMRQSRLPTSFLRRTSATRQLAKAALAEAINHIDLAIGNDPHPGVHLGTSYQQGVVSNVWSHRVFIGAGKATKDSSEGTENKPIYPAYAGENETVPTLTLEGLAYLPPNLINEARYYSQRTPTAKWHSFWFDSGRYAYTAIDVSDYFDVNRMFANKPRAACGSRRLSFAHIFEEGADHSGAGTGAEKWDDSFMAQYRQVNKANDTITYNTFPFVSLADFNIAWGSRTIGDLKCPFTDFIKTGKAYDCGNAEDDPDAEKYRCMTFVTDSWAPDPVNNYVPGSEISKKIEKRDLVDEQPFLDADLNGNTQPTLRNVLRYVGSDLIKESNTKANLRNHICPLGVVQLWDYLDVNRVPVSLAVPTLEKVPMIVGIEPTSLPAFAVERKLNEDNDGDDKVEEEPAVKRTSTRTVVYYLSPRKIASKHTGVKALVAYPFLSRGPAEKDFDVKIDGRVEVFFTNDQMGLRPERPVDALHLSNDDSQEIQGAGIKNNAVIAIPLKQASVPISAKQMANQTGSQKEIDKAHVKEIELPGRDDLLRAADDMAFLRVTYKWISEEWDTSANGGKGGWITGGPQNSHKDPLPADLTAATCDFWPLTKDGELDAKNDKVLGILQKGDSLANANVNVSVRLRLKYNDDYFGEKTVDLVPACVRDDGFLNGATADPGMASFFGSCYPLLRYNATIGDGTTQSATFGFSLANLDAIAGKPQTIAIDTTKNNARIIVNDPRCNHMSENWYSVSGSGDFAEKWVEEVHTMVGNIADCDGDMYMFTSDQGLMQSVYELAFLPRYTNLKRNNYDMCADYLTLRTQNINDYKTFGSSAGSALDYNTMWRTYRCFGGAESQRFDEIGITCGDRGMKVNPYSDLTKVLVAAFANTPHDWRAAAVDPEDITVRKNAGSAKTFNENHAWNGYDVNKFENGKLCWEHLESVAEALQEDVRDKAVQGDWEAEKKEYESGGKKPRELWAHAFENLDWSKDKRKLLDSMEQLDADDSDLYGVDKKFLYGFWHDSFAARQQLFLIFLRAEPMMMGGGVKGQIPPQLGARAVALVWRDPTATTGTRTVNNLSLPNPHRTRILFYHQFD